MRTSEARASSSSGSVLPSIVSGARQQLLDRRRIERLEHQHARARQQRRDRARTTGSRWWRRPARWCRPPSPGRKLSCWARLKRWISSTNSSVPCPGLASRARASNTFFEVGDAGEDRGNLLEMQVGRLRQQPRHRGLAGAGRAPEDQRAERARLQHARERAVGAEQMVLPDHLGQAWSGAAGRRAAAARRARGRAAANRLAARGRALGMRKVGDRRRRPQAPRGREADR